MAALLAAGGALLAGAPALAAGPHPGAGCLSDATRAAAAQERLDPGQRSRLGPLLAAAADAAKAGDGAACRRAADEALQVAGLPPLAPILLSTSMAGEPRGPEAAVPAPPRSGASAGSTPGPVAAANQAAPPGTPSPARTTGPGTTAQSAAVQQANAGAGDPAHGQAVAKVCTACHSVDKAAAIRVGPPLYGVEGRPIASVSGFGYSAALRSKSGPWDDAALNAFLKNPRSWAPGTRMAYPGIANDRDRADVVAYLNTLK